MKSVLYISHQPHPVHRSFAESVNGRVVTLPVRAFVDAVKRWPLFGYLYPLVSLLVSIIVSAPEEVVLIDGGSALYVAVWIKFRNRHLRLIYLDGDLYFHTLDKRGWLVKKISALFYQQIDAAISVSESNQDALKKYLQVPSEVCHAYPVHRPRQATIPRKSYGLYVGRLDPEKNIERILEYGLHCPYIEKFIVVGDGGLREMVEKIAKKHEKIIYDGVTNNVSEYYSRCTFLFHLPDRDPFPCVVMEAALHGCFPLMSRGCGTSILFDDIFISDSPRDIGKNDEKIRYILDNEELSRAALAKATHLFPTKESAMANFRRSFTNLAVTK